MISDDWIGLVPAAGKGVRLNLPYPKELYPIIRNNRYKPVSQFVIECLHAAGIQHIVFIVNETKHQLMGFFGNGQRFGCRFSYVVQENLENNSASTSPGLAHAIDAAYHLTREKIVFFGMPDTILQPLNVFQQSIQNLDQGDVILCLFPTTSPQKFGMVDFKLDGNVSEVIDKPAHTHLEYMWGCMVWKSGFTEFLHESVQAGIMDFASIMNRAIEHQFRFLAVIVEGGNFIDLGTYSEIVDFDRKFREDME